jgi:hypothetical protein
MAEEKYLTVEDFDPVISKAVGELRSFGEIMQQLVNQFSSDSEQQIRRQWMAAIDEITKRTTKLYEHARACAWTLDQAREKARQDRAPKVPYFDMADDKELAQAR